MLPLVSRRNSSSNVGRRSERCLNIVFGRQKAVDRVSNELSHGNALTLGTVAEPNALLLGQVDLCSNSRHIHHAVYSTLRQLAARQRNAPSAIRPCGRCNDVSAELRRRRPIEALFAMLGELRIGEYADTKI